MTYQAALGQGAAAMRDLVAQMAAIGSHAALLDDPAAAILDIDRMVTDAIRSRELPKDEIGYPLRRQPAAMDRQGPRQRSEPRGVEGAGRGKQDPGRNGNAIPMDGVCVRIGAMRRHSQAMTVKLRRAVPMDEVEECSPRRTTGCVVPNRREESLAELTPAAVSGKLTVPVGRLRKLPMERGLFGSFFRGRPAALGCRRAPAAHGADPPWTPG